MRQMAMLLAVGIFTSGCDQIVGRMTRGKLESAPVSVESSSASKGDVTKQLIGEWSCRNESGSASELAFDGSGMMEMRMLNTDAGRFAAISSELDDQGSGDAAGGRTANRTVISIGTYEVGDTGVVIKVLGVSVQGSKYYLRLETEDSRRNLLLKNINFPTGIQGGAFEFTWSSSSDPAKTGARASCRRLSSAFRLPERRLASGGSDRSPAASPGRAYVRAGGFICNHPGMIVGQNQLRDRGMGIAFQGCAQFGADVPVNILGEDATFGAIQVGNSGGTGWVDSRDLVRR